MPPKYLHILSACLSALAFAANAEDAPVYTLIEGQTVTTFDQFKECDACPEMIVVPLGSFMMGAIPGESRNPFDFYGEGATGTVRGPDDVNIIPNEHPRHQVEMDIPYAMARNEITHHEWMLCVSDGGCAHNPDHRVLTPQGYRDLGPDHPVINVSYLDIQNYVAWLNALVGAEVYRLPTEAEWEYAARAGTTTRYAQGDDLTADQANFSRDATENTYKDVFPELTNRRSPVEVHELDAANQWGLRHMSGNVREITLSCDGSTHLGLSNDSAYLDHAMSQSPCRRVGKGGAFNSGMDSLRPARRFRPPENHRRAFYGFRLVRVLTPAAPP